MTVTSILQGQAGIQYGSVSDKSEADPRDSLVNALFAGEFKRGRFDAPFKVTLENIRAVLGYEPDNMIYMAIEDALADGAPFVWVMRVEGANGSISVGISPDLQYQDDWTENDIHWAIEVNGELYPTEIGNGGEYSYLEDYLQENEETLGITGEYIDNDDDSSAVYMRNITNTRKFVRLIPDAPYTNEMRLIGNPTAKIDSDGVISVWLEANNEVIKPEPEPEPEVCDCEQSWVLIPELTPDVTLGYYDELVVVIKNAAQQTHISPQEGTPIIVLLTSTLMDHPFKDHLELIRCDGEGTLLRNKTDDCLTLSIWTLSKNSSGIKDPTGYLSDTDLCAYDASEVIPEPEEPEPPFSITPADLVFKIETVNPTPSAFLIHSGDFIVNTETSEVMVLATTDNYTDSYTFPTGIYAFRRSDTASSSVRWEIGGKPLTEIIQLPESNKVHSLAFSVSHPAGYTSSLVKVPTSLPVNLTDLSNMFKGCVLFNQPLESWDVSGVLNINYMFSGAKEFNQPIFSNTSNVLSMVGLFSSTSKFNQPLNLDTSKTENMSEMFTSAESFNQDISALDVSKASNMQMMFYFAESFNQNLSKWCVPLVTQEPHQFSVASQLTPENLPVWGTCPVVIADPAITGMTNGSMLKVILRAGDAVLKVDGAVIQPTTSDHYHDKYDVLGDGTPKLVEVSPTGKQLWEVVFSSGLKEVTNWTDKGIGLRTIIRLGVDIETVPNHIPTTLTTLALMFSSSKYFNQDISSWNTSKITNMNTMFSGASIFNQPLNSWDVSNVVDMEDMFTYAKLFDQPLLSWNTSKVTTMEEMFYGASTFNGDITAWDVSSVTMMGEMFREAEKFNQNISNWDVSNVNYMGQMFYSAKIFNQNISNWDVSNVNYMSEMFYNAKMFDQNLSGWCVSKVPVKPPQFNSNSAITEVHLPVWGTCPNG